MTNHTWRHFKPGDLALTSKGNVAIVLGPGRDDRTVLVMHLGHGRDMIQRIAGLRPVTLDQLNDKQLAQLAAHRLEYGYDRDY